MMKTFQMFVDVGNKLRSEYTSGFLASRLLFFDGQSLVKQHFEIGLVS